MILTPCHFGKFKVTEIKNVKFVSGVDLSNGVNW